MSQVINAVGRRKSAVARVYLKPGNGTITVNHRTLEEYFPLEILQYVVRQPFGVTATEGNFDVTINLVGGGIKGQAEAARLGISRCLIGADEELRGALKKAGFLTRDARVVERKKPGRPGARKRFQFSKR
ncbi:MAG: 30S ribosomal protein S9 [Rikenellaceae bacterium]